MASHLSQNSSPDDDTEHVELRTTPQATPQQPPTTSTTTTSPAPQAEPSAVKSRPDPDNAEAREPAPSPPQVRAHQRAISMPAQPERPRPSQPTIRVAYSQSERLPTRPDLARSFSRKDKIKNYIKRETANFFGVSEDGDEEQQDRWMDRRKRLASRSLLGPLKPDYRSFSGRHRHTHSDMPVQLMAEQRPDVLPGTSDLPDSSGAPPPGTSLRRKDSVARMTWNGLSYVVNTLTKHRQRPRSQISVSSSKSFPASTHAIGDQDSQEEESAFFGRDQSEDVDGVDNLQMRRDSSRDLDQQLRGRWMRRPPSVGVDPRQVGGPSVGSTRITSSTLDHVLDNSNRRQYGMGFIGRMFGRTLRKSVTEDQFVKEQLDHIEDHRPMFTYWVTIVQVLVLFISLVCYGFGPFGFDLTSRSGQVLVNSLSLQQVDYTEPAHFWYGPRAADLIHLGAKFAPCMRVDDKIAIQIDKTRIKERETACCIRNDDSGCVQSSQADCSKTISTWNKWKSGDKETGGRISGSVCGLDPKYCDAPASVHPYEWPDDITKWPICRKTNMQFSMQKRPRDKQADHMVCEIIGHPCCIGIHGQCTITTKEYCDFVRGTFHEEASLCSQVSCLNDVCGMLPFYSPEVPDQFYRLWTSLFLHAGIIQLVVTILIQWFLMRDLEKLTGSLRIGIIYLGSGVAGNLASAIFVPYRADVGPAGSQFGLLACFIVEVLNAWPMLQHPNQALCKLLSITGFLFLMGLLPWVDNYSHLFGFVFGFLLSYALLPYIVFGKKYDPNRKILLIYVCLLTAAFLFLCLVLLFYIIPVYDCKVCSYLNCLPLTRDFCASQNINFKTDDHQV